MSEVTRQDGIIHVRPGGDIVASVAKDFKQELLSLLRDKPPELIIDMTGVGMVDSVGLGVLIAAFNTIRETGGKLVFMHASSEIQGLFRTMRLDKHFTIIC